MIYAYVLQFLYFVFYDMLSACRFVATDVMIVRFQNVDKQCI